MDSVLASGARQTRPLNMKTGLYIHIPFCHARCGYCDFATVVGYEDQIGSYLNALSKEMSFYAGNKIDTLFIGGGTPSVLNPSQINQLFTALHQNFDFSKNLEATVEMNPESVSQDGLEVFIKGGINRVSMGLQTTHNALLKKMDRLHTVEEFFKKYEWVRTAGIQNINVDLIYGLPGQDLQQWFDDLDTVCSLDPQHISTYALKVETGTPFSNAGIEVDGDNQAEMYLEAVKRLEKKGFVHYEISNFSQPGYECQHNLMYWKNERFFGLGLSGASHESGRRWQNTKAFKEYIQQMQNEDFKRDSVPMTEMEIKREKIMLELRLREGVEEKTIHSLKIDMVDSFLKRGLAKIENGKYRMTPQGWLLSNQLFQHFV